MQVTLLTQHDASPFRIGDVDEGVPHLTFETGAAHLLGVICDLCFWFVFLFLFFLFAARCRHMEAVTLSVDGSS